MAARLNVVLVGYGAIGASVCALLQAEPAIAITHILVTDPARHAAQAPGLPFAAQLGSARPDLLVECAGHSAIAQHVLPALQRGIPCVVVSIGALATPGVAEQLAQAAADGGTTVQLLAGAVGAIDALAAARIGGLDQVHYEGRKPPRAWRGTVAEAACDLAALSQPHCIFDGSAREAARRFPQNANVAATVALAGLGLDATQVALYADPCITDNHHHIHAQGAFGTLDLTLRGKPLQANPKTSALTVYSVVRAVMMRVRGVVV